jgi:hypothetical protein
MARKQTIDAILGLFKKLGGNTSEVLGTKTNVNFLGKGKSPELMLDMDINPEALGVLPQSKAVEELTNSVGYAVSGKLNDIQANQLLKNMQTMESFYFPTIPENITDLATGTSGLDKAGLMSLRQGGDPTKYKVGDPITSENFGATGFAPDNTNLRRARELDEARVRKEMKEKYGFTDEKLDEIKNTPVDLPEGVDPRDTILPSSMIDDLPPPGSRGGPEDIAAPFSGAGLEAIKNVKGSNLIINDIVDKIYMNAGVTKAAQPAARGNAREFLNRIKDMEDPSFPGGTTLSSVMEADDFRFMTEGGGGGMGDPLLLVQKYFGPRVASSVAQLDSADDIQKFAERLVRVKDAKGNSITDRNFDPESVDPNTLQGIDVFDFADGGRVPFFAGMLVRGGRMGYQALRKYGIEGKDISRLYASLGTDKSLVGKEKTEYFRTLNKVLRNPDDFPDEIMEIQKQLGIDVGLGFKNGGLAGILEV